MDGKCFDLDLYGGPIKSNFLDIKLNFDDDEFSLYFLRDNISLDEFLTIRYNVLILQFSKQKYKI